MEDLTKQRPKGSLPRLDARQKVKLLAGSYLDVCVATSPSSSLQTRFLADRVRARPAPDSFTWDDGSYWDLERAMDRLRVEKSKQFVWFWRLYVAGEEQGWRLSHRDPTVDVAAYKANLARQGLTRVLEVVKARTGGNIYVPRTVCVRAGYLESEASEAEKPRRKAA